MSVILSVQIVAFVNKDIKATPENISKAMSILNQAEGVQYLPNIINGQAIDLFTNKVDMVKTLSFVSDDGKYHINFMKDRLDCTITFDGQPDMTIKTASLLCKETVEKILNEYEMLSNRLALNVNLLSAVIDDSFLKNQIGKNTSLSLNFYKDRAVSEWSSRVNSREKIDINDEENELNIITDMNLVQSEDQKKVLILHMDINTVPEARAYRFKVEDLTDFITKVELKAVEIAADFKELYTNEA